MGDSHATHLDARVVAVGGEAECEEVRRVVVVPPQPRNLKQGRRTRFAFNWWFHSVRYSGLLSILGSPI